MNSWSTKRTTGLALVCFSVLGLSWSCSQSGSSEPGGSGGNGSGNSGSGGSGSGGAKTTGSGGASVGSGGAQSSGGTQGSGGASSGGISGSGGAATGGVVGTGSGGASTGGDNGTAGASTGGATANGGAGAGAAGGKPGGSGGMMGSNGGAAVIMAGGPSVCPTGTSTICDGFEDAAPGAATSVWTTTGTAPTVDTTMAYRGTKSLKFNAASSGYIVETKTFAGATKATNNNLWGRYFVRSNEPRAMIPGAFMSHCVFGVLEAAGAKGYLFHFVGGSRSKLQAEIQFAADQYTDSMRMPMATDPSYPAMEDGWQCWEFHVTADDSFNFYINGAEVTEMQIVAGKATLSKNNFSPLPIFGELGLGWQNFSGGAFVYWLDEVAVGPDRIGCNN